MHNNLFFIRSVFFFFFAPHLLNYMTSLSTQVAKAEYYDIYFKASRIVKHTQTVEKINIK